MTSTKDPH